MRVVFNSSLPRSGSTLLQNVLAQNPQIYCSQTSGVLELLYAARQNFTTLDEFKLKEPHFFDKAWTGFCRAALEGFYGGLTDKPVVVDKSRGWIYYYDWLKQFHPNPKVVVCIRDLRAILSSMEKLHRRNAQLHDPADDPAKMNFVTVGQRVQHWLSAPPVGLAVQRLSDAMLKGNHRHFFFVVYEHFVRDPVPVMDALYAYFDLPSYPHDFTSVAQVVSENDNIHGVYGDHTIRQQVQPTQQDWEDTLGVELSRRVVQNNSWFYQYFYPHVKV